jgi:MinD-like ATPase involved in chromosome partitioning or flagellar assembly
MRVISFYSYKGGTGRTLLVANLAVYAARLGRTVAMVDLDLEAPGLAYKFLPSPPARPGVIEWLTAARQPTMAEMSERLDVHHPFNDGGALWLISAGPPPSQTYLRDVRRLQSTAFADDSAHAVAGMLDLRDAIEAQLNPDVLLLDARTGISNTNAVTTRVLADDVVALTLSTREQLEGTREVLRSLVPLTKPHDTEQPLGLHIVVSRIPDPERDERIAGQVRQYLTEPAEPLTATLVVPESRLLLLHEDAAVADKEHLLLAEGTNFDRSRPLHFDYLRVAERLWGSDILGPAVAEAFANISDTQRFERGEFFGDIDQILMAKAPAVSAEIRPPPGQDRSALTRKVDLLRKAAKADPARQPDLATALVDLAWATFDARTPSTSNGLRFIREAQRIYGDLAARQPAQYDAAFLDSLIQYSAMAAQLGHLHDAQTVAAQAVDVATEDTADQLIPAVLKGKALANLAAVRHGAGQSHLAADPIQAATNIFDAQLDSHQQPDVDFLLLRAGTHNHRAVIEATLGHTTQALRSANAAATAYRDILSREEPPPSASARAGLGRALNNLANIRRARSQFNKAIEAAEEATAALRDLAADEPETYLADLASAYQTLSLSFADIGEHSRALQIAEHAAHLWRDLVDTPSGQRDVAGLINALNNVAARYGHLGQYQDAIRAATEAIDLSRTTEQQMRDRPNPDETLILALQQATAPTWANLAVIYRNSQQPERALEAALTAQAAYATFQPTHQRTDLDLNMSIAESYLALDDPANAYTYARQAIALSEELEQPAARASAHRLAARARLHDDSTTAIEHAEQSLTLATATGDLTGQALSMQILADAHGAAGNTQRAAAMRKKASELRGEALHGSGPG